MWVGCVIHIHIYLSCHHPWNSVRNICPSALCVAVVVVFSISLGLHPYSTYSPAFQCWNISMVTEMLTHTHIFEETLYKSVHPLSKCCVSFDEGLTQHLWHRQRLRQLLGLAGPLTDASVQPGHASAPLLHRELLSSVLLLLWWCHDLSFPQGAVVSVRLDRHCRKKS